VRKVNPDKLFELDSVMVHFRSVRNDHEETVSATELAQSFMDPQLSYTVPADLQELFETARGALCYGCFFYPLYTLGIDQLWRVLDAATDHKCRELGASKRKTERFGQRIKWLVNAGLILPEDEKRWDAARQLRNGASHADRQSIYDPATALGLNKSVCEQVNSLFPKVGASSSVPRNARSSTKQK